MWLATSFISEKIKTFTNHIHLSLQKLLKENVITQVPNFFLKHRIHGLI
jgi:hypothetical protein